LNVPDDEVFLTTEEVLEYLQVNLRTIYRLIKANKIPAVRVGRQWRFRKRDIDSWLNRQRSEPPQTPEISPPSGDRGEGRRVLIVDDEASIREFLSKTLALENYEVETVDSGGAALDRMRTSSYDLLIADLKMPGIDGLTLIRQAKSLNADLRTIIVTGYSSESSAIEAVNLGVNRYLLKPFSIPKILSAAAEALSS
jgi:excisionase family DNA binding protein